MKWDRRPRERSKNSQCVCVMNSCNILSSLRLREIGMSEHDNEMYLTMLGKVQRQIQTLRVMLANIQVGMT